MSWSAFALDTGYPCPAHWFSVSALNRRPSQPPIVHSRGAATARAVAIVPVPEGIRVAMAQVALASGRSETEVWAEAADAWLLAHHVDNGPLPPTPAAALPIPRRSRCWDSIDDLLSGLRLPLAENRCERSQRAA